MVSVKTTRIFNSIFLIENLVLTGFLNIFVVQKILRVRISTASKKDWKFDPTHEFLTFNTGLITHIKTDPNLL